MSRRSVQISKDTADKLVNIRRDRGLSTTQQAINASIDLAALFGDKTTLEIEAALALANELKQAVAKGNTVTVSQSGISSEGPDGHTKLVITGLGLHRT